MCTCNTFCWTRHLFRTILIGPVAIEGRQLCALVFHSAGPQLFNTTLIVPVALEGRELCAPVLHSAGTDSYLTLL
jgi:hypothetical protein